MLQLRLRAGPARTASRTHHGRHRALGPCLGSYLPTERKLSWPRSAGLNFSTFSVIKVRDHRRGTVVGTSNVHYSPELNPLRGFRWTADAGMVALDTLGGASSSAADINDREQSR
jgi:hypothetical protein